MLKKYIVKLPSNFKFIYSNGANKLVLVSPFTRKIIDLKFKLSVVSKSNSIFVTKIPCSSESIKKKIGSKTSRVFQVSQIKSFVSQLSSINTKKLILVGIGYRSFIKKTTNFFFLQLKLGYSHQILVKIPRTVTVICPKPNLILISSYSLIDLNKLVSLIRSFKIPEPYKGKGILHEYEKIVLKEGKKS